MMKSLVMLLLAARASGKAKGYDYIVVGGGTAGSVVASRLAEASDVLLLNIAGAPPGAYNSPVLVSDEYIVSSNLSATKGMSARFYQPAYEPVVHFSTGETGSSPARFLGGSSIVGLTHFLYNYTMDWAPGWDTQAMKNAFMRMKIQPTLHPNYLHPLTQAFMGQTEGARPTPSSQRPDGTKITAYAAYLRGAPERLTVMHGVRADQLIIRDGACVGVKALRLGGKAKKYVDLYAKKEVILSSGFVYTPRLLFLSGIGDARELEAAGIEVVRDLPAVGKNLLAPRFTPVSWHTEVPTLSRMMGAPISSGGPAVKEAFQSVLAEATVHLDEDTIAQFMPLYYAPKSAPLQYSLQGEPWPLSTNAYTMLVTMKTQAGGSIKFDKDPDVSPVVTVDPMTPEDLRRGGAAVDEAVKMGGALPNLGRVEHAQDWSTVYDGRGTCRMGTGPETSVVDTSLRVHGVRGLRIVDGSVIPVGTPYLAMPEVLATSERAAELIADVETLSVADVPPGTALLDAVTEQVDLAAVPEQRTTEPPQLAVPFLATLSAALGSLSLFLLARLRGQSAPAEDGYYVQA